MRTKHYHMQLCFDVSVDVKRYEVCHVLGAIGKIVTPNVNWALDKETRDIVNKKQGSRTLIHQLCEIWTLWKAHTRLISCFLIFKQNTP